MKDVSHWGAAAAYLVTGVVLWLISSSMLSEAAQVDEIRSALGVASEGSAFASLLGYLGLMSMAVGVLMPAAPLFRNRP